MQSSAEKEPMTADCIGMDSSKEQKSNWRGFSRRGDKKRYEKPATKAYKKARELKEPKRAGEDYERIFDRAA